jgi:hypothetical protein
MKRFFNVIALLLLLTAVASCGGKKQGNATAESSEWLDIDAEQNRDSTIYGICTDGAAMHTIQLQTDNGDTITIDVMQAQENEKVFGGYEPGDRMAVVTNRNQTQAVTVINLSVLLGDWVIPNPLDGTSVMGLSIRDGGIAESINQSSQIYKTWRLVNGNLELVSIREGGGDFEETEYYRFRMLTEDSLIIDSGEQIFEYSHPDKEDDLNSLDLDLNDVDVDDMVI